MLRRSYGDLRSRVNTIPFQERFPIAELRKQHCLLLMHKNIIQQQLA
jgi:hypothetical protein